MRSLLVLAFSVSAFAQSNAIPSLAYGPQEFMSPHGGPLVQTAQFPVAALVDGPYTLFVFTEHGKHVDTGTIKVNGNILVGPGPLANGLIQVPVTLDTFGQNTLEVDLNGPPGGSVLIAVTGNSYAFAEDYGLRIPLGLPIPEFHADGAPHKAHVPAWIPQDIDWRTKGAVTPVKNEGSCEASWAFSATGAVEGALVTLDAHSLLSLSEQQLLDCAPRLKICADESPVRALQYLVALSKDGGGADSEASYPYTGTIGACKDPAGKNAVAKISTVTVLPPGEASLQGMLSQQPVSVVLNENFLSTYHSGIETGASCGTAPPQYRAALVVGFTAAYWLVKTSSGPSAGIGGYVQLQRGKNACGINNYLVVAK